MNPELLIMHYELCIMNCFRAFRLSPSGFPLYLCSPCFRLAHSGYGLGTSTGSVTSSPSPKLVPVSLAKDAAPIPNALEATDIKLPTSSTVNSSYKELFLMERPYWSFRDVCLGRRRRYARRRLSIPCLLACRQGNILR